MSAANNEDDVTRSICSIALELRHELEASKLTLDKNKSMIVSNRKSLAKRVQRILRVNDLHFPVADATRDLGINAVGGTRRRRTRNLRLRAARRRGSRVKGNGPEEPQSSQALHHRHLAVHRLWGGTIWLVTNRPEAGPSCSSGVLGSRRVPKSSGTSAPLHFLLMAPFLGQKTATCICLYRRRGGVSTPDSEAQRTDGVSCEDHVQCSGDVDGFELDPVRTRQMEISVRRLVGTHGRRLHQHTG